MNLQMAPYVSKAALVKDFPQIENAVYSLGTAPVLLRDGEATATENVHLVDGNLFAILKFPFILGDRERSEEHTSELQSLMRISYAVFCLKKKQVIETLPTSYSNI